LSSALRELQSAGSPRSRGDSHSTSERNIQDDVSVPHVHSPSVTPTVKGESSLTPSFTSAALPAAVLASAQDSRRYKLWRVPEVTDGFCFQLIGQGGLFCIIKKCTTKHRGVKFFHPLPGEVYVQKTQDLAFIAPVMPANILGNSLWER